MESREPNKDQPGCDLPNPFVACLLRVAPVRSRNGKGLTQVREFPKEIPDAAKQM